VASLARHGLGGDLQEDPGRGTEPGLRGELSRQHQRLAGLGEQRQRGLRAAHQDHFQRLGQPRRERGIRRHQRWRTGHHRAHPARHLEHPVGIDLECAAKSVAAAVHVQARLGEFECERPLRVGKQRVEALIACVGGIDQQPAVVFEHLHQALPGTVAGRGRLRQDGLRPVPRRLRLPGFEPQEPPLADGEALRAVPGAEDDDIARRLPVELTSLGNRRRATGQAPGNDLEAAVLCQGQLRVDARAIRAGQQALVRARPVERIAARVHVDHRRRGRLRGWGHRWSSGLFRLATRNSDCGQSKNKVAHFRLTPFMPPSEACSNRKSHRRLCRSRRASSSAFLLVERCFACMINHARRPARRAARLGHGLTARGRVPGTPRRSAPGSAPRCRDRCPGRAP
jgi:hypothetical protein